MVDQRKQQRGTNVLTLLNQDRLAHTPDHYAFAHGYLNDANGNICSRVDGAVEGGMR